MTPNDLQSLIAAQSADDPDFAVKIVDALLAASAAAGASDLHLLPTADGLSLRWRIDGVLQPLGAIPRAMATNVITRMKVLARLLTYQTTTPQEGRIALPQGGVDVRISTFPTVFGEKIVARNLPQGPQRLERLDDLALPADSIAALSAAIAQTSARSSLRALQGAARRRRRTRACARSSIARVSRAASRPWRTPSSRSLRGSRSRRFPRLRVSIFSQVCDRWCVRIPRSSSLARYAIRKRQALRCRRCSTGQLVVTTFHASDAAVAASRLADMGIPPYVMRSAVRTIVAQRLLRRLCQCATTAAADDAARLLGVADAAVRMPRGCDACRSTGYLGRVVVAEAMQLDDAEVAQAVLDRRDASTIRDAAIRSGMRPLVSQAADLVAAGVTSSAEALRVFGDSIASISSGSI